MYLCVNHVRMLSHLLQLACFSSFKIGFEVYTYQQHVASVHSLSLWSAISQFIFFLLCVQMIFKITNSFARNVGEQVCLCAYGEFLYYRKYLGVEFMKGIRVQFHCCCSVAQSDLCDPMDCSPLGLCVPHHLPRFAQVHVPCSSSCQFYQALLNCSPKWLYPFHSRQCFVRVSVTSCPC